MRSWRRDRPAMGAVLLALLLIVVGVVGWSGIPARATPPSSSLSVGTVVTNLPGSVPVAPCRRGDCPGAAMMCSGSGCASISASALVAAAGVPLAPPSRELVRLIAEFQLLPGGVSHHPIVPPPRFAA